MLVNAEPPPVWPLYHHSQQHQHHYDEPFQHPLQHPLQQQRASSTGRRPPNLHPAVDLDVSCRCPFYQHQYLPSPSRSQSPSSPSQPATGATTVFASASPSPSAPAPAPAPPSSSTTFFQLALPVIASHATALPRPHSSRLGAPIMDVSPKDNAQPRSACTECQRRKQRVS